MRTETDTNASKKRATEIADKDTILTKPPVGVRSIDKLMSSVGARSINKLIDKQAEDDEGEANGPRRRRRKRNKRRDRNGGEARKGIATKTSVPIVATDYMTTREAAAYLKLSRQFLESARYRGDSSGPPYIKLERAVRYRKSVLDAWMAAHDHSPDKPL